MGILRPHDDTNRNPYAGGTRIRVPYTTMTINTHTLATPPPLQAIITELDEFKNAWRAVSGIAPERFRALKRVATVESVGSSTRIEGARLSDDEVQKLLAGLDIRRFDTRDEQEVAGYAAVMETVFAHADAIDITENHIKQLHRDLLIHSTKDARHRGRYKTHPNHVSAFDADGKEIGVVFQTATPFDTPRLMTELAQWRAARERDGDLHPLLAIAVFIVVFLEIHPFQDGNGRLSRILTTLLLLRAGYAYAPYSSLESVIEQSKQEYYLALRQTQSTIRSDRPDWRPWTAFFLAAMRQQKRRLAEKVNVEKIMADAMAGATAAPDTDAMATTLPPLSAQILALAHRHGNLTNAQIVALTDANRNTVKKHLATLTATGRLTRHGKGKGAWYRLPDIALHKPLAD